MRTASVADDSSTRKIWTWLLPSIITLVEPVMVTGVKICNVLLRVIVPDTPKQMSVTVESARPARRLPAPLSATVVTV